VTATHRRRVAGDAIARGSLGLIVASMAANLLGFLFWLVAARLHPVAAVGSATAATSTMSLAAALTVSGAGPLLLRRLPGAGAAALRLVRRTYLLGGTLPVVGAGAVLALSSPGVPRAALVLTVIGAGLTGWCLVADAVSVAGRAAGQVAVRNLTSGGLRTVLLVGTAAAASGVTAILATWVLALSVGALHQQRRLRPVIATLAEQDHSSEHRRGETVWHHLTLLGQQLPSFTLPIVVAAALDAATAGRFYVAWYAGAAIFMLGAQIANVVLTESARAGGDVGDLLRRGVRLFALIAILPIAVAAAGSDTLLSLFGEEYRSAATLLTLLALSALPIAVNSFAISLWRLRYRLGRAMTCTVVPGLGTVLGSVWAFRTGAGIEATGWIWLASQSAVSAFTIPTLLRATRRP